MRRFIIVDSNVDKIKTAIDRNYTSWYNSFQESSAFVLLAFPLRGGVSVGEERARILQMVGNGQVSAEEGVGLLRAVGEPSQSAEQTRTGNPGWLRVRVMELESGRPKVSVNLPLSLVRTAARWGSRFAPETEGLDWDELVDVLQNGAQGKIVDVEDDSSGERVQVFVE